MEHFRNNSIGLIDRIKALILCLMVVQMMLIAAVVKGQSPNAIDAPVLRHFKTDDGVSEVRKIYNSQIGVREKQVNSGPEVEKYLRYVNLPKGNPWCAAFVCWVYGQANVPNPRSGWSPDLFPASRVVWQRSAKSQRPKPADVFGIYFPEKGRIAHVGFVDQWKEPWLITVEGNTNLVGGREGDGVYRKRRLVRSVYKVVRYVD